jgi:hypothetical protein
VSVIEILKKKKKRKGKKKNISENITECEFKTAEPEEKKGK